MSVRQNDRRQNVRSAKCLSAKCLSAKRPGTILFGLFCFTVVSAVVSLRGGFTGMMPLILFKLAGMMPLILWTREAYWSAQLCTLKPYGLNKRSEFMSKNRINFSN
jgi:hypothetical protein